MVKHKEKIEDPLKLLLPGVIYDYFELVHTEISDVDVHLFLDEVSNPPRRVGYESKGFTEQSIIQDFGSVVNSGGGLKILSKYCS